MRVRFSVVGIDMNPDHKKQPRLSQHSVSSAGGPPCHVTSSRGKPWRAQAPVYFKQGRFIEELVTQDKLHKVRLRLGELI